MGHCERSTDRTARWRSQRASHTGRVAAIENSGSAKFLQIVRAGAYRSRSRATLQASSDHRPMLKSEADTCLCAWGDLSMYSLGWGETEDLEARTGNSEDCRYCHRRSTDAVLTKPVHPLDSARSERLASSALMGSEDLACKARMPESKENPEGSRPNTSAAA